MTSRTRPSARAALWRHDGPILVGPTIAVELPDISHFLDLIEVNFVDEQLILVATGRRKYLPARIADV